MKRVKQIKKHRIRHRSAIKRAKSTHIIPAGGNVFVDLGFELEEAAGLLAETDNAISAKLALDAEKNSSMREQYLHYVMNEEDGAVVARCVEIDMATEGDTVEEALVNLQEAIDLYFENENPAVSKSGRRKVISLESAQGFMGSNPEGAKQQQVDANFKKIVYLTRKSQ